MNTINTIQNSSTWNTQSSNAVTGTESNHKVHNHHKKKDTQDSVNISDEGKITANNSSSSFLDSLVANGTITQDQENSIKSAFQSARQANQIRTYGTTPTNPISSLVASGTITQTQADSITTAFKSKIQSNENNNQAAGTQGSMKHHHHHKVEAQTSTDTDSSHSTVQAADNTNTDQSTVQGTNDDDLLLNNILTQAQTQDPLMQSEENDA